VLLGRPGAVYAAIMCRLSCLLLVVVGCYDPHPVAGAPCSNGRPCPDTQVCMADDRCWPVGLPVPDARVDPLDAPIDGPVGVGPWSARPVLGEVNTGSDEDDPSCTLDRKTIVFARKTTVYELFIGTRPTPSDRFTVTALAVLNGISSGDKDSPEISMDGTTIYFTADAGDDNNDVYVSKKTGNGWSTPALVKDLSDPDPVVDDTDVAISPDGLTAMVARDGKMYIATRGTTDAKFTSSGPVAITVEGSNTVAAPSITNHADVVYLHAGNAERKLYYTRREAGSYTKPELIMELDTQVRNSAPFVLPDEHYMLFSRGLDIYEATR